MSTMMMLATVALVCCLGVALRPNLPVSADTIDSHAVSAAVAKLSALRLENRSSPADSLALLGTANQIVSGIASQEAPPSLSDETKEALAGVIVLIQQTVYSEMDAGHQTDVDSLSSAADALSSCNADLQQSILVTGAIGLAEQAASSRQAMYTTAAEHVSSKTAEKTDKQVAFEAHMRAIQQLPTCNAYPTEKVEGALTAYFNVPPDVAAFNQQKAAFQEKKDDYHGAVEDLEDAIGKLAESMGALKDSYCNMVVSMQTGCKTLDSCYSTALNNFEEVKGKAESNAKLRSDAYAAGEAATKHLQLLLGLDASEGPAEPRYDVEFPIPVPKNDCSVEAMEGRQEWEEFLNVSSCDQARGLVAQLLSGCSTKPLWSQFYGHPRLESVDKKAGEAVCCNAAGQAVNKFRGVCTRFIPGKFFTNVEKSQTFAEALAICQREGMRLCQSHSELDTACNTKGCGSIDHALVWIGDGTEE